MVDVTSWFVEQTWKKNPDNLVKKFMIGTSDYAGNVITWPKPKQIWDSIRPHNTKIDLYNEDQSLNFIRDDTTNLVLQCKAQIGYTHPTSGDELVTILQGTTDKVKYSRGKASIHLIDKFDQLSKRLIGTSDVPVDYTGSNHLVSDLAWYICTSHGGYSAVESTSNPDIDYVAFQEWAEIFSLDTVFVEARYDGINAAKALRSLAHITRSAIFLSDNKISFNRFGVGGTSLFTLDSSNIRSLDSDIDMEDVINQQYVFFDYSVDSDYFTQTVIETDSASVNSYGLIEAEEQNDKVWYVDSNSALNLAQRIINVHKVPFDKLKVDTTLYGLSAEVGDVVTVVDSHLGIDGDFRVMGRNTDFDKGRMQFQLDASQLEQLFILDTSQLDGPDALG